MANVLYNIRQDYGKYIEASIPLEIRPQAGDVIKHQGKIYIVKHVEFQTSGFSTQPRTPTIVVRLKG